MSQKKYKYHDWDEYFRGHNVLNCNAIQQQSGPCQKAKDKEGCKDECESVLNRLSARRAMKERWLKKISNHYNNNEHYGRWGDRRERKHLQAFICRNQHECMTKPWGEECKMCKHVMQEYMQEYNKRVRTTNKLGLRFEETNRFREPGTFGKRTRKEDPQQYATK